MDTFLYQCIIVVLVICALVVLLYTYTKTTLKAQDDRVDTDRYYKTTPEEIIVTLNYIMDLEMGYMVELPFEGRDIKRITDFESVLHDLTNNTANALNDEFFKKSRAAGFKDDYILEYITRGCTTRIVKFMSDNNAGYITPPKEEDEEE